MAQTTISTITSIADVDHIIANEALPASLTRPFNPYELLFWEQSTQHQRLVHLKHLFRGHPAVDAQFIERRNIHLHTTHNPSLVHLRSYERAFVEVNRANGGSFGSGRVRRFLDLGCSPGGYSCWLLKANRDAVGLGLTLPDAEAKFSMSGEPAAVGGARYRVRYDNIITLAMSAVAQGTNPVVTLDDVGDGVDFADANGTPFDLVIAGAFPTLEGHIPWWLRVQLVLSQVLTIMSNVAQGGACVVVLNTKPFLWIVDLLGMLRASFRTVSACKSGKFHAKRSSCYVVCRGFRATPLDVREYTDRIRAALQHLDVVAYESRIGGGDADTKLGVPGVVPQGLRTASGHEDLPLLSGQSASLIFEAQSRFVLDLFEPMWDAQFAAIRAEFAEVLSPQPRGGWISVHGGDGPAGDAPGAELALTPPPSPVTGRWRARGASVSGPVSPPEGGYVSHPAFKFRNLTVAPANEAGPLTPPASPPVPKWRPQRRTTVSGDRAGSDDWRRRGNNGAPATVAEQPAPYREVGGSNDLFGPRRASESGGAPSTATWWRSK